MEIPSSNDIKSTKLIPKMVQAITEIPYGLGHLPRSFEQKHRVSLQEAQDFLTATKIFFLPKENPYFKDQEEPILREPIASGYYNSCWKFETSMGTWVMKIGHRKSPIQTKLHPSSEGYSKAYKRSLDIQREIFNRDLPNLIPEPQEVLYVTGQQRVTTVVIQPFIHSTMPFNKIKGLSVEHQQNIKGELEIFLKLCRTMQEKHGILPDMIRAGGKEGHLVIAQRDNVPHLVMLDNDVFNTMSPTPLFTWLNSLALEHKVPKAIKKLK